MTRAATDSYRLGRVLVLTTRIARLRCWLARIVVGKHGSVTRMMSDEEWRVYIRESVAAEIAWAEHEGYEEGRRRQ